LHRQIAFPGSAQIPPPVSLATGKQFGLFPDLSVRHNLTMTGLARCCAGPLIRHRLERATALDQIRRFRIRAAGEDAPVRYLSGGNQQKVVISKWLVRGARVFLFDEPTRGIDVGAKAEVFETMDQLVRNGAAVLMVSSELPELLQVADRILVMREGAIAGELPGRTTQEEIMHLATRH